MSSEILELYFRIVIAYLKDDDGIIDSREYKELISLMTKIKVSKQLANDLRKYRFEDKEDLTIEELIDHLKIKLIKIIFRSCSRTNFGYGYYRNE